MRKIKKIAEKNHEGGNMNFHDILEAMIEKNISDAFIRSHSSFRGKVCTHLETINEKVLSVDEVNAIVHQILDGRDIDTQKFHTQRSCELALWYRNEWRFRIGIFYQRNTPAIVIRKINLNLPSFKDLNLPEDVLGKFCIQNRGLILITGVTGSGKSTTIASMLEYMNQNYARHILTIEDPIEFTFNDKKSIFNQREVGRDVLNYPDALRQFALHSPDVIYIGVIRDTETCASVLAAAETGVLVVATLHSVNATSTVERILNFFPPYQHQHVLNQLSTLLKGVVTLRLLPCKQEKKVMPAYEVMSLSPSISRLIRENKLYEVDKYISTGDIYGMITFHQCLEKLVEEGHITAQVALDYADKPQEMELALRNKGLL